MGQTSVCNIPYQRNGNSTRCEKIPQTGQQKAAQKPLHRAAKPAVVLLLLVVLVVAFPLETLIRYFPLRFTSLTSSPSPTATATPPRTFCIGTDFPTQYDDGDEGIHLERGVNLAISLSNLDSGYTLKACNKSDVSPTTGGHDPNKGRKNIQDFIDDQNVIGVIGPANSNVARAEIPLAAQKSLPIVGPDIADSCLTVPDDCSTNEERIQVHPPEVRNPSFLRICGTDLQQTRAIYHLFKQILHLRTVFIVDDTEIYGQEIAKDFVASIGNYGGIILGQDTSKGKTLDQLDLLAKHIVSLQPDSVLYAGTTVNNGKQLKDLLDKAKFSGFFIGGAGIANDPRLLEDASNTYAVDLGPDPSKFDPNFIKEYKRRYGDPYPDSAKGYDAAMILITAIKNVINNKPQMLQDNDITELRRRVLANLQDPKFQYQSWATRLPISFDSNGDNMAQKTFVVYAVENGQWVYKPDYDYPISG